MQYKVRVTSAIHEMKRQTRLGQQPDPFRCKGLPLAMPTHLAAKKGRRYFPKQIEVGLVHCIDARLGVCFQGVSPQDHDARYGLSQRDVGVTKYGSTRTKPSKSMKPSPTKESNCSTVCDNRKFHVKRQDRKSDGARGSSQRDARRTLLND